MVELFVLNKNKIFVIQLKNIIILPISQKFNDLPRRTQYLACLKKLKIENKIICVHYFESKKQIFTSGWLCNKAIITRTTK